MRPSRFLPLVLAFASLLAAGPAAFAQAYPDKSKPVKIIVPFAAGGSVDLLARAYGRAMSEVAGVNAIVDNRAGAEAVIGVQALMNSPADGYTLMLASSSAITLGPVTNPGTPYDPLKDFVPLAAVAKTPFVMLLGAGSPFKTAREFVAAARANPGKYTCASASASTRMACELLQARAGIKLLIVPYKAAPAAMTALAAGEVDTHITDRGTAKAMLAAGRVRAVATTGATRSPTMAELPTLREEGVQDYTLVVWFAAYMPLNTPPDAAQAMREILRKGTRTKLVEEFMASASMEPMDVEGADLTAMTKAEIDTWNGLIKASNIKSN